MTLASICREMPVIAPEVTSQTVFEIVENDPAIRILPVMRSGQIVGMIERERFLMTLAMPFGRAVYVRREVELVMDRAPMTLEATLTLAEASRLLADSAPQALQSGFLVTACGTYCGVVHGVDLVREMALASEANRTALEESLRDLRAAQKSLVESEKIAALGGLVAGIAHEINTPIGTALTAATVLEERSREFKLLAAMPNLRRSDLNEFVDEMEEASQFILLNIRRTSELIRSFKLIAVDQASDQRRSFLLGDYLAEVITSFAPRLRPTPHTVKIDCPPDVELEGYPGAVAQIVTNLLMNALVHAFPAGCAGRITITVVSTGDDVEFRFKDDGVGIPATVRPRIFDPFFTTRRGLGGTGLGLNVVHNLTTGVLGGRIDIESAEGEGTTVVLRFPRRAPRSPGPPQDL